MNLGTPTTSYNDADLYYLTEAFAALDTAVQLSNIAAVGGLDADVRALARWTLAAQSGLARAIEDCLEALVCGSDQDVAAPHARLDPVPAALRLRSLDGAELDRAFVELLRTHVQASLRRARAEMVKGMNPDARQIAEAAIHKHGHELDALERLAAVSNA